LKEVKRGFSKPMETAAQETLSIEAVWKRVPLLRRVVSDVVSCHEDRKHSKDFLDQLLVISKKFTSPEIVETMNRLRREISECDRALEAYEKEIRDLGGFLKDPEKGLAYFYSERENRRIFLIWELNAPDLISWHELGETFSDRVPIEHPSGMRPLQDSRKRE
jgi:hypothetical protein